MKDTDSINMYKNMRETLVYLDAVFECTLEMINKDFEVHPEHRTNFFTLLQAVNYYCFSAFLAIPPQQFKLVLDSIIWAFKHTMRNVADTGLSILYQLLQNVSSHPEAAQSFYQTYYTDILQHMFTLVESEKVTVPLNAADKTVTNMVHIQGFVANLLKSAFPHLSDNQIKITVTGLFNLNQDIPGFKDHLRDFLVQIREFTGEDDTDL